MRSISLLPRPAQTILLFLWIMTLFSSRADATWSIVICDSETKEVGIASVTCLSQFNLRAITPVVVVGKGTAAVQAAGDFDGIRRPIIRTLFLLGIAPTSMLSTLSQVAGHASRQYGIVDTQGRTATFTGGLNADWAGGVTGDIGTLSYAIQGNILVGPCVVSAVETALLNTPGDLPTKLMAGMQVAKDAGGDGRCSCAGTPTSCGCPPVSFTKSGHIGYLLVARIGDSEDPVCNANGCADGDYLYALNVGPQSVNAPDPVDQLQVLFDARRAELAGRPDAHASTAAITGGASGPLLTIALADYDGFAVTMPVTITIDHTAASAGLSAIGAPVDLGGGQFEVPLTGTEIPGIDEFLITVDDGFRPVVLSPLPSYCAGSVAAGAADCNGNALPDFCDLAAETSVDLDLDGFPDECALFRRGDCNGDGGIDVADAIFSLEHLFGSAAPTVNCREACNTNGSATYDLGDPITLLSHLFSGGATLPPPFMECGVDVLVPAIDCQAGTVCP